MPDCCLSTFFSFCLQRFKNTAIIVAKMQQLANNPHIIYCYHSLLTNRTHLLRVNGTYSLLVTTSRRVLQGCLSSPLLFTIYTNVYQVTLPLPHQIILWFRSSESAERGESTSFLSVWTCYCSSGSWMCSYWIHLKKKRSSFGPHIILLLL